MSKTKNKTTRLFFPMATATSKTEAMKHTQPGGTESRRRTAAKCIEEHRDIYRNGEISEVSLATGAE